MEKKNVTEVVIDGSIYRLAGYESSEYLQQVAGYINNKITEMKALDGYGHLPTAQKALMMQLNAADDYFKAKKAADHLEKELSEKEKELYTVKHDLVSLQVRQEETGRAILSLREENSDLQKKIVELEARLRQFGADVSGQTAQTFQADKSGEGGLNLTTSPDGQMTFEDPQAAESAAASPGTLIGRTAAPEATAEETEKKDTGDVFRPGSFTEKEDKSQADAGEEDQESSADKSQKTFIPDAAGREAMMRTARENFLAAGRYGSKRHRKH